MNKSLSVLLGLVSCLLIIAPPIPMNVPLIINTFNWCYLVVVAGFLGCLITQFSFPRELKILAVYLLASSFLSQAPYLSFNAYVVVTICFYFFWAARRMDIELFLRFIVGAFILECVLTALQLVGKDTMLSFNNNKSIFMGTVMQYMRYASLLAVMTPFLVLKNKWYLLPIIVLCVISQSSSFALALSAGVTTYALLQLKVCEDRLMVILWGVTFGTLYALYDWGSFRGAILPENGGRLISWLVILKTWCLDTSRAVLIDPWSITGPFNLQWFLFGHGMDTFLPLFPVYKHDMNPFPQAHNSWLQFLWEIGLVGFSLVTIYCINLFRRLYRAKETLLFSGGVMICVNMFFTFPDRMTQTILLLVAYLAVCEQRASLAEAQSSYVRKLLRRVKRSSSYQADSPANVPSAG